MTALNEEPNQNSEPVDAMPKPTAPPSAPKIGQPGDASVPTGKADASFPKVDDLDFRGYIEHVTKWKQPLLSAKYLLALIVVFVYTCEEGYSYIGFASYVLTLRLLAVSAPHLIGHHLQTHDNSIVKKMGDFTFKLGDIIKTQTPLPDAKRITFWTTAVSEKVEERLIAAAKKMTAAETDFRLLKVSLLHLVGVSFLFWIISVRTFVFGMGFFMMVFPPIYSRFHDKIDPLVEQAQKKLEPVTDVVAEKGKEIANLVNTKIQETADAVKAKYHAARATGAADAKKDK